MENVVRIAASLMLNELLPRLRKAGKKITESPVSPQVMAELSILKAAGMPHNVVRQVLDELFDTARKADS